MRCADFPRQRSVLSEAMEEGRRRIMREPLDDLLLYPSFVICP